MTYRSSHHGPAAHYHRKARQYTLAVVLGTVALVALFLTFYPSDASAHRGGQTSAIQRVVNSNMYGQCGKGARAFCYRSTRAAYVIGAADAHSWLLYGYWQERRIGHGRWSCTAAFVSGSHGVGFYPTTKRCVRL